MIEALRPTTSTSICGPAVWRGCHRIAGSGGNGRSHRPAPCWPARAATQPVPRWAPSQNQPWRLRPQRHSWCTPAGSSRGIGPAEGEAGSAMAFAATAGVAGLAVGVPLGANVTAEQRSAVAEGCLRLHRAVAARAGAFQGGWSFQGRGHGLSLLRADKTSLVPAALQWIGWPY